MKMSRGLNTETHFHRVGTRNPRAYTAGDDFYEALIEAHRGLTDAQSQQLNARLVLLLANHIGDLTVIEEALRAARSGLNTPDNSNQEGPP